MILLVSVISSLPIIWLRAALSNFVDNLMKFNHSPVLMSKAIKSPDDSDKCVQVMKWGLIPAFAKGAVERASSFSHFHTSNAKAENLMKRPAYRDSILKGQRCIVIVQG